MFFRNMWYCSSEGLSLGTIGVTDSGIAPTSAFPAEAEDWEGRYLILPGLMDSHLHGLKHCDFSDGTEAAFSTITRELGRRGVAYCAATFVTLETETLKTALAALDAFLQKPAEPGAARIVGVHLEGPCIAQNCKGAHDAAFLKSEVSLPYFIELMRQAPHVTNWKITLAPELEGALSFIEATRELYFEGSRRHVAVFIGHTQAETAFVEEAVRRGACGFTHLGNANGETIHRGVSNCVPEAAASPVVRHALTHDTPVELIADGQHVSADFVAMAYSRLPDKLILVSDALRPAGMPDGEYMLGSLPVVKQNGRIELQDQPGKLAGSALLLPDIIPRFLRMLKDKGVSEAPCLQALWHATAINPRAMLGDTSRLSPKDFVILERQTGKLVLSACNNVVTRHADCPAIKLRGPGFFSDTEPSITGPSNAPVLS